MCYLEKIYIILPLPKYLSFIFKNVNVNENIKSFLSSLQCPPHSISPFEIHGFFDYCYTQFFSLLLHTQTHIVFFFDYCFTHTQQSRVVFSSKGRLLEVSPFRVCVSMSVGTVQVLRRQPYCCGSVDEAPLSFLGDPISQQTFWFCLLL